MATVFLNGTIASGASLSGAIDASGGEIYGIFMPPEWTPANITFQSSPDNVTYYNVYGPRDEEVAVGVNSGRFILLNPFAQEVATKPGMANVWLKIRSGTAAYPVPQTAARQFTLASKTAV